ncbi:MAG: plasmid pRiA4b ORF-3 family protein [Thermoguttaceae bacterium]
MAKWKGENMKKPKTPNNEDAKKARVHANQVVEIPEWVKKALEEVGFKDKPLKHFWLSPAQRDVLLLAPTTPQKVKEKLAKATPVFTIAQVANMAMTLLESLSDGSSEDQAAVLLVVKHLLERLQEEVTGLATKAAAKRKEPKAKTSAATVFQFKITLQGVDPPIWRRIQTKGCTLDKLHEHIQTAMGWTNSHLHQFKIGGVIYGDPQLLYEGWEDEAPPVNSLRTKLSKIVPKDGTRFRFDYEYDFGDGWEHEILFEGFLPSDKGVLYPLCVDGERACPPEDVGGTYGYQDYVKAMANPRHKRHKEFLQWNGPFDPEKFDAQAATKEIRKGVPD